MTDPELLLPGAWMNGSRGLACQLPGLTASDLRLAVDALPSEWEPYVLMSVVLTQRQATGRFAEQVETLNLDQLEKLPDAAGVTFFLGSRTLSPGLFAEGVELTQPVLGINGLVCMRFEHVMMGEVVPSEFSCVSRAIRIADGYKRHHGQYELIFRELCRNARRLIRLRLRPGRGDA